MDLTRKQGQRYDFFATVAHVFTRSTQCPVVVNASTRINDESSRPNTILHFIQLQTESPPEAVGACTGDTCSEASNSLRRVN